MTEPAADLRDRIADVVIPLLLDTLPKVIARSRGYEVADAVLAVLPEPADRAAILAEAADAVFALDYDVMVGEEGDENLGSMREAWDLGTIHAEKLLRRLAAEAPATTQPETEAHPAEHSWAAELYDPLAEEWVPGTRYPVRDRAVNALAHSRRLGPTWKDGTPTRRRLVRATTTYTVEPETVHACPPEGSGITPCCERTPFELPVTDRMTTDPTLVTCAAGVWQDGAQSQHERVKHSGPDAEFCVLCLSGEHERVNESP
jgi:hypothetical protein